MKKILLTTAIIFFYFFSNAQVVSIRPAGALVGQSLRTYITCASGAFANATTSFFQSDIYLKQGASIIYCDPSTNWFSNVYSGCIPNWCDSMYVDFNIPNNAHVGPYDVHVITHDAITFNPVDNVLPNGFTLNLPAGTVEGDVYFDANQNGVRNVGEPGLPNHVVQALSFGLSTLTDQNGHYRLFLGTGNYTISYSPPTGFTRTSLPATYSGVVPPSHTGLDFGTYSVVALYKQIFSVWHHPMRCFPSFGYTYIDLTNNGLLTAQGSITMIHSSNMTFSSSIPAPDFIHGDTLTWLYSNLGVGQHIHIGGSPYIAFVDPPAGQTIWYTTVDSLFDDTGNPIAQYPDSFGFTVTCSCDPNEKEVSPPGVQAEHYTLINSDLVYTLNFQNTGNDTAFTVVLYDTLDSHLDKNTLEVLSSSRPCSVQRTTGGIVQFTFEDIQLPDSTTDEPGSHGFVVFRIHPLSTVTSPTIVYNRAGIVFDANPPVITNRVMNTLVTTIPVGITENNLNNLSNSIYVYPNPFDEQTEIVFINKDHHKFKVELFDEIGKKVLSDITTNEHYEIRKSIPQGVYILKLSDEKGSVVYSGKLVKINK